MWANPGSFRDALIDFLKSAMICLATGLRCRRSEYLVRTCSPTSSTVLSCQPSCPNAASNLKRSSSHVVPLQPALACNRMVLRYSRSRASLLNAVSFLDPLAGPSRLAIECGITWNSSELVPSVGHMGVSHNPPHTSLGRCLRSGLPTYAGVSVLIRRLNIHYFWHYRP